MNKRMQAGGVVLAVVLVLAGLMAGLVLAQGEGIIPSSANTDAVPAVHSAVEEEASGELSAPADAGSSTNGGVLSPIPEPVAEDDLLSEGVESQATLTSWRVLGSTLKPRDSDVVFHTNGSGGCVYVTGGDAYRVWNTPIWLPPGSVVHTMRMYVVDSSASASTCGWFSKYDLYGNLVNEWGGCTNTAAGQVYFTVAITPTEVINYTDYSYALNWRPSATGDSIQLCGFRLMYEAPAYYAGFLPAVTRRH